MTAPDPRAGEIEARLNAATPGPWEWDGTDVSQCDNGWSIVMENTVSCGSYCCGGSVSQEIRPKNQEFIAHSPEDVRYLLAELRKRDEALARVESVCADWAKLADGDKYYARHIRAAVTGDGA